MAGLVGLSLGGSISSPGIAESAPWPLRMSKDGTGERADPKRDSTSARVSGVGITEVASPKRVFMSSRRTFAVSG